MFNKFLILVALLALVMLAGCSDDPVSSDANAPVLTGIGDKTVFVGANLAIEVTATDDDATIPILTTSTLPVGATFIDNQDGTGSFAWTPAEADLGVTEVVFYAADANDAAAVDSEAVAIAVSYQSTGTSLWDADNARWITTLNASDAESFVHFSFTDRDTVSMAKVLATSWDIAFSREIGKLNGGSSTTDASEIVGINFGVVDYAAVTIADTVGAEWVSDAIDYFIDPWYTYNPLNHVTTYNQFVWSMVDAEADNYVKFRIDSVVGAAQPPDMGAVWITYFYQSNTDDIDLSGTTLTAMIDVGAGTGYFDFSAGAQTTPTNPATDLNWDIAFNNYNCFQNSGPFGSGQCQAFSAHGELTDPTDIDSFTAQPAAPMFTDSPSSVFTEWYDYNPATHHLASKGSVFIIDTGTAFYKIRIETYYASVGGSPTSGYYTLIWNKL